MEGEFVFFCFCAVHQTQQKPDYDTALVFVDDGWNNYDVPTWAIKLVLQKEEI